MYEKMRVCDRAIGSGGADEGSIKNVFGTQKSFEKRISKKIRTSGESVDDNRADAAASERRPAARAETRVTELGGVCSGLPGTCGRTCQLHVRVRA
jgi:hypothetical protein